MVVNVEEIREQGLTLEVPVSTEQLGAILALGTSFSAVGPFAFHVHLLKVSRGVLLDGRAALVVRTSCNRCLQPVDEPITLAFTLNLVPESIARGGTEDQAEDAHEHERSGTFALDEADEELFDGRKIDLDPIIREQVLLALPMHTVCDEACKGLCPQCGQNLNEKACGCDPKPLDPRLEALKKIKLEPKQA